METNAMDIESNPVLELVRNPFSCLTCNIVFNKKEIRDDHYKSEWHRYNLHRKLANLPPITLDKFETRTTANEKTENQKEQQNCDICQKKFTNDKQYKNHLMSKKHKEKMKNVNTKNQISETVNINTKMDISDETDIDSDYENSIELNDCLFCDHHSKNVKRNLKHMMIKHSFFVPDPEYCIDQKGLLISLASKIYHDYQCIWCNDSGREMQSAEAVKAHMIDKGHCKMLFEGEALLDYLEYYDYTSSYPDAEDADPDEELPDSETLLDEGFELKLPSGKVIGHRALVRYYKQNLPNSGTIIKTNERKLYKFMTQYRGLGGPMMEVETNKKRIRDIRYMQKIRTKYSTQLQFKQNKLQHHFRPQVNF